MPTLPQSLQNHDLGHLRILAEHWGLELKAPDTRTGLPVVVHQILNREMIVEIVLALPVEAAAALNVLQGSGGRMPWSQYTRRFGEIREMGPGRRDRERPDRDPISAAETLWYRGFVARTFFDTARGPEEFAFIPDDLFLLLPEPMSTGTPSAADLTSVLGRAATAAERVFAILATDRILDHACTLLAALRSGSDPPDMAPYPQEFIHALINLAGLLDPTGIPDPSNTRAFLEAGRGESLVKLAQAWLTSSAHNDLHHIPHLRPEGEWTNDPLQARQFILQLIAALPTGTWWNLSAFVADIRQRHPDFQRPAGDYDSWYLWDDRSAVFLRGFEHWDAVDGALIRYLVTGPLHWLGILDLASPEEGGPPTAFRLSGWAARLLEGAPPIGLPEELSKAHVRSDGRVGVPVLVPRAVRYQLARFCQWEAGNPHEYRYRITPASLSRAGEQNLRINHLLSLLGRYAEAIPPNIVTALDRWDERGTEVRIQDVTILRLGSPQILHSLRNSRAARFLAEPLGPTTVIVKAGAGEKVLAILAEMGYLGEVVNDS